ncbi:MAG: hypothetical protein NT127_08385, partial [Sphingobacteriales bacterium]|nr:hypothetical protein [Sphingobacteriales bacterium]
MQETIEKVKRFFNPGLNNNLDNSAPFKIGDVGNNLVVKTKGDRVIWSIVIILTMASLLLVYSSTGSLAYRMSRSTE